MSCPLKGALLYRTCVEPSGSEGCSWQASGLGVEELHANTGKQFSFTLLGHSDQARKAQGTPRCLGFSASTGRH